MLTATGRISDALDAGGAALPSATGELHAELCFRLARTAVVARRWGDAEAYVQRAGRPDDPRSLLLAADAAFGAGDVERAGRAGGRGGDRVRSAGAIRPCCARPWTSPAGWQRLSDPRRRGPPSPAPRRWPPSTGSCRSRSPR